LVYFLKGKFQSKTKGGFNDDDGPIFEFSMSLGFREKIIPNVNSFFNNSLSILPPLSDDWLNQDLQFEVKFRTKHYDYFYKGKVLENMTGLDLSCNKLTGVIPSQIGDLQQIRAFTSAKLT